MRALLGETRLAWLWLVARVYIGWLWLDSGRQKLGDDAWMDGGVAVRSSWERTVHSPEQGRVPLVYDWYRDIVRFMLNHEWYKWAGPVVAVGETLLGIALILGLFTGLVAMLGSVLSVNGMLAGAAAANPFLLILTILLTLAWKTAGWIGLDRWVLPLVVGPWESADTWRDGNSAGRGRRPAHMTS